MKKQNKIIKIATVALLMLTVFPLYTGKQSAPVGSKVTPTRTATGLASVTPSKTRTPISSFTPSRTATVTPIILTSTPSRTATIPPQATFTHTLTPTSVGNILPYPSAPLCATHDNSIFHTLWNSTEGCHYDHEHGQNAFTAAVEAAFPGFDLQALLGGVQVGHTNPSSPMENTHKHGGFKWHVQLTFPQPCVGFEGATTGGNGGAFLYHGFGNYAVELEGRIHSTVALIRQCRTGNPTDYGTIFINQYQDYGQRITPYQGAVLAYPNQPVPAYPSPRGPYLSINCIGPVVQCRSSLEAAQNNRATSNWASKVSGTGHSGTPNLFRLLWRVEDTYQNILYSDQTHPFTFLWLCTADGGLTYVPLDCGYNNSTTQVHEISGYIPPAWDGLAGWDTDPRVGRITASGFVDGDGNIDTNCLTAGGACYPIKMVNAFVGSYGSVLVFTDGKGSNIVPINPERDVYFCNGVVCASGAINAVPSGWIGSEN